MQDNTKAKEHAQHKKLYVKPEVRQVLLKPEEAVLGGCKNAAAAGSAQPNKCSIGPSPCNAQTS